MTYVLVIEDDAMIRDNILELLTAEGFDVSGAADGKAGIQSMKERLPDVIVCDITMPMMDGHAVLRFVREYPKTSTVPFVFLSARAEREDVRAGMALGADDFLTKPFTRQELLACIRTRVSRHRALEAALGARPASIPPKSKPALGDGAPIIRSEALRRVYRQAALAAASNLSVLLLGETGVGKDVLARSIHETSPRAEQPFIPLNCAALAETLLESELFGHEKGVFTGANAAREGLFEAGHGGTVFLDEVGDLPRATQSKLLRVLEDRRVRRIGARVFREIDVRFIAATNRDLEGEAENGSFRRDLFFRIAGVVLTVPPLRERLEEIAPLAERFARTLCERSGRVPPRITPAAMDLLERYPWPGNVRELRNVVEQSVALCEDDEVRAEHLPPKFAAQEVPRRSQNVESLREELRDVEKQEIISALETHGGNQTLTAKALGISRRTPLHRLDEFGLPRPRKKKQE
ncbi:MAG: two-component system response regulator AtoC [Polyangiales bacterium]|jgi:two-component system response regulator AtoC